MEYAVKVSDVINVFPQRPLKSNQTGSLYCNGTDVYRTDDRYSSLVGEIFESCQKTEGFNSFLLSGHIGSGKSTELNKMSYKLAEKGYYVKTVNCAMDLDLFNIIYYDLFIMMGIALLEIVKESGFKIKNETLDDITGFWNSSTDSGPLKVKGVSAKSESDLTGILDIFDGIKADLKSSERMRKEYRRKAGNGFSRWIRILEDISDEIAKQAGGRYPVMVFDGLDNLNPEYAKTLFYNHAAVLSCMKFPVIYTSPVTILYDEKFMYVENYFVVKIFPLIKTRTIKGVPFQNGINLIYKIVERRVDLNLFETGVLEKLVWYTGGSLRDLFHVINLSAKRALRRHSRTISEEDAGSALETLKTSLVKRIEEKDYKFLLNIYNGNKKGITDRKMFIKMLYMQAVLVYGRGCWFSLHPLIIKFFKDQGLLL